MESLKQKGPGGETPLISIIVPVYKVEACLRRCLDSMIHQSYPNTEILLVDDGSPDQSGAICDEYARKYPNITVIHQENQGQAAARNHAAQRAAGEYITFIDSDDYVESDYTAYLFELIRQNDADLSICGFRYLYEGSEGPGAGKETKTMLLSSEEALKRLNYTQGFGAFPWAKMYKKQLILDHPFPEGQIYEDLAVMYKIFCDAERIAYGDKPLYYWIQRSGSTMRSVFSERQMAAIEATKQQIAYLEEKMPSALPSAKARHEVKIVELTGIAVRSADSKAACRRLKKESKYLGEVLRDKNVRLSQKIRMICIRAGYMPTKCIFGLHEAAKKRAFG